MHDAPQARGYNIIPKKFRFEINFLAEVESVR